MSLTTLWKLMRNSFIRDMEFRINYFILIFATVITFFMELAVFAQIYEGREQVGDLPKTAALGFIILGSLIRSCTSLWQVIFEFVEQIRDGSFRTYLLQPIHFPSYFFAQVTGPKFLTWTLSILGVLALKMSPRFDALLAPAHLPYFLPALALSLMVNWQIYLTLVYAGFWTEEATFMLVAFNLGVGIFSGSILPLSWLPETLQRVLHYSPLPLLGDFPIKAGLGLLSGPEFSRYLVQAVVWMGALAFVNAALWRAGTKRFEAFGG